MEAAFFDLDKTIISRSSSLALSRPLYRAGMVRRGQLLRGAYAQLVYLLVGADENKMERLKEGMLALTKGWDRTPIEHLVQDVLLDVIDPYVYQEALDLMELHRSEGRRIYIVSSSPEEIVRPLARHFGVGGVIATRAQVGEDGRYTGELEFYAYGEQKAEAIGRHRGAHGYRPLGVLRVHGLHHRPPHARGRRRPGGGEPRQGLRRSPRSGTADPGLPPAGPTALADRVCGAHARAVDRGRGRRGRRGSGLGLGRVPIAQRGTSPTRLMSLLARRQRPTRCGSRIRGVASDSLFGGLEGSRTHAMPGSGTLTLTGQLGEVMKESARAALSWFRAHAAAYGADPDFFKNAEIHLHVPAGAIPKDGPSAGVTMATALASELTRRPVRGDIAMTGEITLSGRVLPVGGIKEKVLAARRVGIREVILPRQNEKNVNEDLTEELRKGLTVHYVQSVDEVLLLALAPNPTATTASRKTARRAQPAMQ